MFGYVYSRLKTALIPEFRRAGSKDLDSSVKTLQRELSSVQAELAELRRSHQSLVVKEWTQSREPLLATLDARLSVEPIRAHVLEAVARATVCADPTTHAVIE